MTKTAKIIVGIIVVVVLIWLVVSSTGKNNGPTTTTLEPIKIGAILPLSGDFAAIGEELKKGIDLAIDQLQKQKVDVSAVYEDDRFDSKEVVTAANKLITVDKVNLAVLFSVTEARPVIPIFNDNKIPLVSMWDGNDFLKTAGPYIFSTGFSTEKAGKDMADFAFKYLKLKNIAIISHVEAWSGIISKSFADQFEKDGGKVVFSDSVQVATSDFRLIIQKMKRKNPDGIYFPLIPFDSVSFIKQVNQNNIKVPMMSGDALIQEVIDSAGVASEGIYFTNAFPLDSDQLLGFYKDKYKKDPPALTYTAAGFDGVMRIGEALKFSRDIKTSFERAFGVSYRVEKLFQVKNGKPVELSVQN